MNLIHVAGHLGADAEVRYTPSGKKLISLRVAARGRRNPNNQDTTIWWRATLWGDQWDKMVPYLKKGSAVIVVGEVHKPEIFHDREGKPQIAMELTASYLGFSPFGKPGGASQQQSQEGGAGFAQSQEMAPAAHFGAPPQESAVASSPYGGFPGGEKAGAFSSQNAGETFDDEVPF